MDRFFDYKFRCNGIDFCYSRKPDIDEREIHMYHEILYYIDGGAELICESFRHTLKPQTLLIIPKEHYHFLQLSDPERFERLKISFSDVDGFEPLVEQILSEIKIIEAPFTKAIGILDGVCKTMAEGCGDTRTEAFAYGSFLISLSHLTQNVGGVTATDKSSGTEGKKMMTQLLRYIDDNLSSSLKTEELARQLNISSSSLSHIFKNEMGISLHQYITQKRLILASKLIDSGSNPTKIYCDCGYGDYSSFYKAYLKMFGSPPSHTKKE